MQFLLSQLELTISRLKMESINR